MEYDIQEILKILPHKQPFLFVDKAVVDEDTGWLREPNASATMNRFFRAIFRTIR